MRSGPWSPSGFSLVEVLVASVVFVTGVVAVVPLVTWSVRATRLARDTSMATWLAWQKVEELKPFAVETPAREERLDEGGRAVATGVYTRRWRVEAVDADLLRLVVSVSHPTAPGAPVRVAAIRRRLGP